uniref:Salivary secreted protein n=1 Tax=Triatoma infestans TaxID=30076 RepID=A6YPI9_TRIIF|nr:salivary secreted protein [Triatoma infestans]
MARGIVITLLLVTCLYVTYGWAPHQYGNHSLIIGRKGYNDVILFQKTVSKKNWNPFGKVSEDVTYPVRPIPGRRPLITEIDAIDLDSNDKGGYAYVLKGGINRNNVTIHFKSQKGRGYKFNLTIFGRIY